MLTDEQKATIRAEEFYRDEVRRALQRKEAPPTAAQRLWATINSSFFLWMMSSVVLAVVSFLYQENAARRTQREQRVETMRKLDAEISSRLWFFRNQLLSGTSQKDAVRMLDNPGASEFATGVFTEYSSRTFRGLLWELGSLVPAETQTEIKRAADQCPKLVRIYFFATNEDALVQEVNISVSFKGIDAALDDFFGDLDRAATAAEIKAGKKTAAAATPAPEKPPEPRNPVTKAHAIQIQSKMLDEKNPILSAFNLERWNRPFSGLMDQFWEKLKKDDPEAYEILSKEGGLVLPTSPRR